MTSPPTLRGPDGAGLAIIKWVARTTFRLQTALVRRRLARRGELNWKLGGDCQKCAACCEEPSIQVDRITWYLPTLRRLFVWWQHTVNGFELVRTERPRVFVFRCQYFDTSTRRCTSYS